MESANALKSDGVTKYRRPIDISLGTSPAPDIPDSQPKPEDEPAVEAVQASSKPKATSLAWAKNRYVLVGAGAAVAVLAAGVSAYVATRPGSGRLSALSVPPAPALRQDAPVPHPAPPPAALAAAQAPPAPVQPVPMQRAPMPPVTAQPAPAQPAAAPTSAARPEHITTPKPDPASDEQARSLVKALDLITATNANMLQLKKQNDDMAQQVKAMRTEITELQQRISLNEASAAVAAVSAPATSTLPQKTSVKVAEASQPSCYGRPHYIIASVSPRYVTLRAGDEALIDLARGSTIPCYGVIKDIMQEGARWVVKTDHDIIGRD